MSPEPERLVQILARVDARARAIADEHPDWPCRAGCDACCRRLGRPPELRRAEWQRLWRSFSRLDAPARAAIRARVGALEAAQAAGEAHVVCPFLDGARGRCQVYEDRPAACRSYGFYVSRGEGRYCDQIRAAVDAGAYDDVIWGNQDALDGELERALGPLISIFRWFADASSEIEPGAEGAAAQSSSSPGSTERKTSPLAILGKK